jgi:uncharacterized Zn finger protein (UPF0148 family)
VGNRNNTLPTRSCLLFQEGAMLAKSCPRCAGWIMHQTTGVGLIESSCVMCGWVIYGDDPARRRILSAADSSQIAKKQVAKDSEPP